MKRIMKSRIFLVILTAILCTSIGVYATTQYNASQITYNKNGQATVDAALNDLYNKANTNITELLWTNSNPTTNFAAQTVSLDLSDYKYVIVVTKTQTSIDYQPRTSTIIPVVDENTNINIGIGVSRDRAIRYAKATETGIVFSAGHYGLDDYNEFAIPYKIYGVKQDLNIDIESE